MTTIAIDEHMIAIDSLTVGDFAYQSSRKKLYFIDEFILATCGATQDAIKFFQLFKDVCSKIDYNKLYLKLDLDDRPLFYDGKLDNFSALVFNKNSEICYRYDEKLVPYVVDYPYALGSGSEYAMGAMYAGKNAKEAVDIACELDIYSGGDVHSVMLSKNENNR